MHERTGAVTLLARRPGVADTPRVIRRSASVPLSIAALVLACGAPETIVGCEPDDHATPICGFSNPEDLIDLPGGAWIAVSEYAPPNGTGRLVAFRNSDGAIRPLFPAEEELGSAAVTKGWGDPACPGPPDPSVFAPHGIDVVTGSKRPPLLAVVNHGGREAIEFFEVGYSRGGPALVWRGCVVLPEDTWPNDVALLADGSLMVTDMFSPPDDLAGILDVLRIFTGGDTGRVLAWREDAGWVEVPGSEGAAPNGIAVSPDGRDLFFAEWAGGRLVRIRLDAGNASRRSEIDVPHLPDNLNWTRDGRLLVTGQSEPLGDVLACGRIESGTCAIGFSVLRVEPVTLDAEVLVDYKGKAMGAGTSALEVGDDLLVGTFAGDRIARFKLR